MKYLSPLICTTALVFMASPAHAQVNGFGESEGFTVGLGVIADWSPYEGADTPSTTPIPYLAYDWENAHLGVDGFSYSFFNTDALELSALVEPRWSFGDPEDSPLFEDIERDTALEAGLEAELDFGGLFIRANILHDISDVHNGFEGSAEAGFAAELGEVQLRTSVGYAYRDKSLSTHLYGVRAEEAREGLGAYTPDASWYPYVSADAIYPISSSMGILAFARYEHLNSDATDSPLITKDRDATFGAAFLKRF
ncbi:MipA/OmpV family protein [Litorimonas sp. RW-G-Af-16]|uniref:MipA/OmpV family protein n=1 Tax=Litorimonas sp. RW-G-Af-16 TaxID=3241168 RepID=UPI00390C9382